MRKLNLQENEYKSQPRTSFPGSLFSASLLVVQKAPSNTSSPKIIDILILVNSEKRVLSGRTSEIRDKGTKQVCHESCPPHRYPLVFRERGLALHESAL